jgi:hypothetical protein
MNAKTFARLHRAHARSGLSIAAFCRRQRVALSTFHYWRRRFPAPDAPSDFVELRLGDQAALPIRTSPIRLELRGATLTLPENFSESSLRQVLAALRECLPC